MSTIVCTLCNRPIPDGKHRVLVAVKCECGAVGNFQHAPSTEEEMAAGLRAVALRALDDGVEPRIVLKALGDLVVEVAEREKAAPG